MVRGGNSGGGAGKFPAFGDIATFQGLGDLAGGAFTSHALSVSADGSVVVGEGWSAWCWQGFRWTADDGMVGLGGSFDGRSVSADGSVVVGRGRSDSGDEAFIWDQINGMRSLQDVLTEYGALGLTGWQLTYARGISADGLTIVGYGTNPLGQTEAWRATLPNPVPLPGAVLLGALGLSVAGWRLRRERA